MKTYFLEHKPLLPIELKIHQLLCAGKNGIYPEEKKTEQNFLIDANILVDGTELALQDEIESTVNYSSCSHWIRQFLRQSQFSLLETLTLNLTRGLLKKFATIQRTTVTVTKHPASWRDSGTHFSATTTACWIPVILGLGSNLGDRIGELTRAREAIEDLPFTRLIKKSPVHETEPLLYSDQPHFLNTAILIETLLSPIELLQQTQRIENQQQRRRDIPKGPRTIDIDILLYGNEVFNRERLKLPHPDLSQRRFWLAELDYLGVKIEPAPGTMNQSAPRLLDLTY